MNGFLKKNNKKEMVFKFFAFAFSLAFFSFFP